MNPTFVRFGFAGIAMVCLSAFGAAIAGPAGLAVGPGIIIGAKWYKMTAGSQA